MNRQRYTAAILTKTLQAIASWGSTHKLNKTSAQYNLHANSTPGSLIYKKRACKAHAEQKARCPFWRYPSVSVVALPWELAGETKF